MAAHQSAFCKTIYAICPVFDIEPLNEVLGCAPTLNGTRFARGLPCSPNNTVWRVDESTVQAMQRADGAGDLWRSSCPSNQAGPFRPAWPRPCLRGFWRTPPIETPPLWAICTSAWLSAQKSTAWCSVGTSCAPTCAHCLLSHPWAPLKRARLCPPCTLLSGICTHWWDLPSAFSSLGYTVPAPSAFLTREALQSYYCFDGSLLDSLCISHLLGSPELLTLGNIHWNSASFRNEMLGVLLGTRNGKRNLLHAWFWTGLEERPPNLKNWDEVSQTSSASVRWDSFYPFYRSASLCTETKQSLNNF